MHIRIEQTRIKYNNQEIQIDDLLDTAFYQKYNSQVEKYNNDTFIVNELYLYYVQRYLAVSDFIYGNNVNNISIIRTDIVTEAMVRDIADQRAIKIKGEWYFNFKYVLNRVSTFFIILTSAIYLMYLMAKIPFRKKEDMESDAFCVISNAKRVINGNTKIKINNIDKEVEDLYYKKSIYGLYPLVTRLKIITNALFISFRYMNQFRKIASEYSGVNSSVFIDRFYAKRIVYALLYEGVLDRYLESNKERTFYTEHNLDRNAIIEEQLTKKHGIKFICIPHGIEYGFKFPKGFVGDIHYTTSRYAQDYLNNLYNTTKFVFDTDIADSMFKVENPTPTMPKVIFFTEPREVHVNLAILEGILPLMKRAGIELYLKLHPKDIKSDYAKYNLEIIENFNDAIVNNICFARKSSILLEATYNNSVSSAILINKKDESMFNVFASLQSDKIVITRSIEELFDWINESYAAKLNEDVTSIP